MKESKLQQMIIKHLIKNGELQILLPDGLKLDIGITQEGVNGEQHKIEDYCWLMASHRDRRVAIDSYNLGLQFIDGDDTLLLEDFDVNEEGTPEKYMTIC